MISVETARVLFGILSFVVGAVFGSFGSVLVSRIPYGKSIRGRSRCPECGRELAARDLIPIVSFLLLGGACRACAKRIPWKYPLLEIGGGFIFLIGFFVADTGITQAVFLTLSLWFLLLIAVSDAEFQGIPDVFNIAFLFCSVAYSLLLGAFDWRAPLVGAGFFGTQWLLSRGRWVGSGDVLLAAGIGALLGPWEKAVLAIGLSYIIGSVFAVFLLLVHRKTRTDRLAFGPFLAAATAVVFFFGDAVLSLLFLA